MKYMLKNLITATLVGAEDNRSLMSTIMEYEIKK